MSRREAEESTYGDATMHPHPPQQIDRQVRVNSRQLERGRGRSSLEKEAKSQKFADAPWNRRKQTSAKGAGGKD